MTTLAVFALGTPKHHPTNIVVEGERTIILEGVIFNNAVEAARQVKLLDDGSGKPITIKIKSPGGSLMHGGQLVAAMEASKTPIITICEFRCASMAAVIHSYGTTRYMIGGSYLMWHPSSVGIQGETERVILQLLSFRAYYDKFLKRAANMVGMELQAFKDRIQLEWWLSSDEAITHNLSDGNVSVQITDEDKAFRAVEDVDPFAGFFKRRPSEEATDVVW
jgi:ATP-dependent protease ClpP protease subunit